MPANVALQEARQALAEIRGLKEAFGVNNIVVNRALNRIEAAVTALSGAKDADVKAIYGLLWKVAGGVIALLISAVLTLIGVVYGLATAHPPA